MLRTVVFIATAAAIYSLGYGLHTFTAAPRSTQPSTLREIVKWLWAYGLNNNNGDGGCGWQLPIFGRLTAQVDWLDLRVGGHPACSLYSSSEPGEPSQWLWSWWQHHKHCHGYYYYYYYYYWLHMTSDVILLIGKHNCVLCWNVMCRTDNGNSSVCSLQTVSFVLSTALAIIVMLTI